MKYNQDRDVMRKEITERVSEILNIPVDKIKSDTPLIVYGMDSLSFFNVSFELEEKYGINVIEDKVSMDVTIDGLIDVITKKETI
jgi:acyl carrier protein